MNTTKKEHIEWVKKRALIELENSSVESAIASLQSDLIKHPDTQNHPDLELLMNLIITGGTPDKSAMKTFIEGIN